MPFKNGQVVVMKSYKEIKKTKLFFIDGITEQDWKFGIPELDILGRSGEKYIIGNITLGTVPCANIFSIGEPLKQLQWYWPLVWFDNPKPESKQLELDF